VTSCPFVAPFTLLGGVLCDPPFLTKLSSPEVSEERSVPTFCCTTSSSRTFPLISFWIVLLTSSFTVEMYDHSPPGRPPPPPPTGISHSPFVVLFYLLSRSFWSSRFPDHLLQEFSPSPSPRRFISIGFGTSTAPPPRGFFLPRSYEVFFPHQRLIS